MGKGLLFVFIFVFGISQLMLGQAPDLTHSKKGQKIHADLIVIKLKNAGSSSSGRIAFSTEEQLHKLKEISGYDSFHQVFDGPRISNGRATESVLQNIYKLKFSNKTNIWKELSEINQLEFIEYAEPFFQNELLLIPNDPQADPNGGLQDYLTVIKAYGGWQINPSDSTMVIGIVDTGVNMNHEDLDNIAFNHDDPIDGLDNDGDGYIDNFHGWDIGNNDNDPTADSHPHGTHVTGISSAKVNNAIGMAGIGFNSKYLPINAWNSTSSRFMNEYEGIVYAADHGAKVVNLSWGGAGNFSRYGQDIINYAVLEKNVVIVAAAGNTHEELEFYPASYNNVLSVGATDMEDNMATWATYSHFIDVMAPGQKIYSTKNNGGYEASGGSSFAAPMVAGAAALVRSHFPAFSAQQVMEQIRVTSDNIYNVGSNMDYYGKMGRGRLNVQKALSDILTPSIRLSHFDYESNHGELIFPGDSVGITFKFTNYLRVAENITITISNPSANVNWEVDQIYIDKLSENESYENKDNPISFTVNQDVEPGDRLLFRIDYVGNNYTDFQYIEIKTTPEYFNISDGNFTATIASDGDIGYDEQYYRNGDGVSFFEDHIASNTGLIISLDSSHVMDNLINDFENYTRDEDFVAETKARLYDNSIADYDARSVFRPNDTISSALNIKIEQKVLAWENETNNGALIFEYRIINTGDSTLLGLNAGLYADWDLGEFEANEAAWDDADEFAYVFDKENNQSYAGLALLTNQIKSHHAIDIDSLNGNIGEIGSVFNDKIKHEFLAKINKYTAGTLGAGNDVAQIVGGKGIDLNPNQSIKIAFAMLSSTSLNGLRSALDNARTNYELYMDHPPLAETFFACDGDSAMVDPEGEIYEFYEDAEATVRIDSGYAFRTKPVYNDQEYYIVNLDSGYAGDVMKIIVKPGNPTADFLKATDTLLIEVGQSTFLKLENRSALSDEWTWDFGNGYSSVVEHPTTNYEEPGLYQLVLIASNTYGCTDTANQNLLVAIRLERAIVDDQEICKGTRAMISASNTSQIEVYGDPNLTNLLYAGNEYETNGIFEDQSFYVVNAEGDFESVASEMKLSVKHPEMGFDYEIDTINLEEQYVLNINNSHGQTENISWRIDNQTIGSGPSIKYAYIDDPFEISQIKVDAEGCRDTLRVDVLPRYSSKPVIEDAIVCKNGSFSITPQNGDLFYFYKDMEQTQLVHKGRSWKVKNILKDVEYFVTGIDDLLESASTKIRITIDPVQALIQASSDTIDLAHQNDVVIRNISMNEVDSYWLLPTGTFDTTKVISETYDLPGTYEYSLVAEGNNGCYDTTIQYIQVIYITGINDGYLSSVSAFPNPATDLLTVDLGENHYKKMEFELIDVFGNIQRKFMIDSGETYCQIDVTTLKNGIYFIRSLAEDDPVNFKILKR